MIDVDFHVHSIFSLCGMHTYIELLVRGRELGMKGLAITDHGPALGGSKIPMTFYDRLLAPVSGIRLLKGMECNVVDEQGTIDIPMEKIRYLEVVLVGLHYINFPHDDPVKNTLLLVAAIHKNPCIDIVSHPHETEFPMDYEVLAQAAAARGVALELNNSKLSLGKASPEIATALIRACKKHQCPMVLGSDTHALNELGDDTAARPLLEQEKFPEALLINSSAEKAFSFVENRRGGKKAVGYRLEAGGPREESGER